MKFWILNLEKYFIDLCVSSLRRWQIYLSFEVVERVLEDCWCQNVCSGASECVLKDCWCQNVCSGASECVL